MLNFLNFFLRYNVFEPLTVRSGQWKTTRKKHLLKQPFCQVCGSKKQLVVHHVIPVSVDNEKENDFDNLITLCEYNNCHFLFGHLCNWTNHNRDIRSDAAYWRYKIEKFKNLANSPKSIQSRGS